MLLLSEIRGQDRALGALRRAVNRGRVAHAYLFCGPAGCGKHTTGIAVAAALNCTHAPGQGCAQCDSCLKIAADNHPDVRTLRREGAAQIIPIATIRAGVIPQLGRPPHEGNARVFLVEEATSMQDPAANALLKTLEEPPARTHFIFCTTAPDKLLPTIRSRCQRINFAALPPDLRAQLAQDDDTAAHLTELADQLHAAAAQIDSGSLYRAATEASRQRTDVVPVLQLLVRRLHDDAVDAASYDLERAASISRQAAIVLETETALTMHNAHGQIALEALLHQLRKVAPLP